MKFIIGFLVTIGLLVVVFILIFRGASNRNDAPQPPKLVSYANSSRVMQYTDDGPINLDQNHRQVRITVSNQEVAIEVFRGYNNDLVSSKTYPNNSTAYGDFLRALQLNGYTTGNTQKAVSDERGYCASGHRYIFGIKDGDDDIQRLWTTSCGTNISFKGKTDPIRNLFIRQVPDYSKIYNDTF